MKKIKTNIYAPMIYSIVVSSKVGDYLHLGVHYTLDEAFIVARDNLFASAKHTVDDAETIKIEFWRVMPVENLSNSCYEEKPIEVKKDRPVEDPVLVIGNQIKLAKKQKNNIMKGIISVKNFSLLEQAKPILSNSEIKFIKNKLLISK